MATGLALSIASGLLLAAAFPPTGAGAVAWFALVPLFIALMRHARSGAAFGLYYAAAFSVWILAMIRGVPPGYEALYGSVVVCFAAVFLFTCWQRLLLTGNDFRFFTAITAASFISFEFVRQYTYFVQFACLGISQYRNPWAIQIASWFGVFGVSLLIVLSNCTIALVFANLRALEKVKRQIAVNALIFAALMSLNIYLLHKPVNETGRVKVAAVQYGYVPEAKEHPAQDKYMLEQKYFGPEGKAEMVIDILGPMTEAAARKGAKIVVWPEVVLGVNPAKFPKISRRLSGLASRSKIYLIAPYNDPFPGREKEDNPPSKNGASVIAPDGKVIADYTKQHRVTPFNIEQGTRGDKSVPIDTPFGRMGLMICYDADFPDVANAYTRNGAEFFALPSHDLAMFVTRHHPALLLFRAVEHRRSLVKADIVHGALITDPKGRILADPPDGLQMAMAEIPVTRDKTPFPKLSLVLGAGALILLPAFLLMAKAQKASAARRV